MRTGPLTPLPELKQMRDELRRLLDPRNPKRPPPDEIGRYYDQLVHLEQLVREALDTKSNVTHLRYRSRT